MRKTSEQSMERKMAVGKLGRKWSRIIPSEFHSFRRELNVFSFFQEKNLTSKKEKVSAGSSWFYWEEVLNFLGFLREKCPAMTQNYGKPSTGHPHLTNSELMPVQSIPATVPQARTPGAISDVRAAVAVSEYGGEGRASRSGKSHWCKRTICHLSGPHYPVKYASMGENIENSARLCSLFVK